MDIFELTCKVLDQNLFTQVDWARNSVYFKELKVGLDYCSPFSFECLGICYIFEVFVMI